MHISPKIIIFELLYIYCIYIAYLLHILLHILHFVLHTLCIFCFAYFAYSSSTCKIFCKIFSVSSILWDIYFKIFCILFCQWHIILHIFLHIGVHIILHIFLVYFFHLKNIVHIVRIMDIGLHIVLICLPKKPSRQITRTLLVTKALDLCGTVASVQSAKTANKKHKQKM